MSVLPYLIVLTVAVAAIVLAIALIKRIDMRPSEERP
jgi:hypothetical protein